VNEVLDLSKIEAGKMELAPEDVQLSPLLEEAVGSFKDAAAQKGTELSLHIEGDLGVIVCDPMRVRQVLVQLVDNAVKFTAAGRIDVSARRFAGPDSEMLEVRVRDTGVGIAAQNIPLLFEKFTVASDASASKYGGTGLGLALSKKLCGLMGGDIRVESQTGVGSCFTMILPTFPPAEPDLADDEEAGADSAGAHWAASPQEAAPLVHAAA
jgi:signal transduction histidine kinase